MSITRKNPETWQELQTSVSSILSECGFASGVAKTVLGPRGKKEIDVYAVETLQGRKYTTICECKYWKNSIPQEVIHSFRTVISDLGFHKGYVIPSSSFQSGAYETAQFTNIELLTWEQFQEQFFEGWFQRFFVEQLTERLDLLMTYCEPFAPKWYASISDDDKRGYLDTFKQYYGISFLVARFFSKYGRIDNAEQPIPTLPLKAYLDNDDKLLTILSDEI